MVQSVELLLDPDIDATVRAEWRRLSSARLPSQDRIT
ncbi:2'-5' RNA ligase family protein, partial [Rhodococcus hoagii]|nr:2'-5' RNA ligase family protein [Prescottella equi]